MANTREPFKELESKEKTNIPRTSWCPSTQSITSYLSSRASSTASYLHNTASSVARFVGASRAPIPRLKMEGEYGLGALFPASKEDGSGFNDVFKKACEAANKHPSRMCELWFAHRRLVVIDNPATIKKLSTEYKKYLGGYDPSGIYEELFGKSILTEPTTSPIWERERQFYMKALAHPERSEPLFHTILNRHINAVQDDVIPDLKSFTNNLAMDFIGETQLGWRNISDNDKCDLNHLMQEIVRNITNPLTVFEMNYTLTRQLPGARRLSELITRGQTIIQRLIERNLDNIFENNPLLLQRLNLDLNESLSKEERTSTLRKKLLSKQGIQTAAMLLFAGFKSTAELFLFSLMLLADPDNHEIASRLRHKLADVSKSETTKEDKSSTWTKAKLDQVPELLNAINNTLDLYPSFPVFKDSVSKRCNIDGVELLPGDIILYSPLQAQRSEEWRGENAGKFSIDAELSEFQDTYTAFGLIPRTCPGRHLSRYEAKLVAAAMLSRFPDLRLYQLEPENVEKNKDSFPECKVSSFKQPYPITYRFSIDLNAQACLELKKGALERKRVKDAKAQAHMTAAEAPRARLSI